MLCGSGRSSEQPGLALVLESEALAVDADDGRVMEDAVEHRCGEHAVAGEGGFPAAEGEIGGQDHRAALVSAGDDLEEQVGIPLKSSVKNPKAHKVQNRRTGPYGRRTAPNPRLLD